MPKTRSDGSPLTTDYLKFWNQPYVYQDFPKMLYRRPQSGRARSPASETLQFEGTTNTLARIVPEYATVQSAAEQKATIGEGWADLPTMLARA